MADAHRDDDCSLDSVPSELRAAYFAYREECSSERMLSGKAWMAWRASGHGKAEEFIHNTHDKEQTQ